MTWEKSTEIDSCVWKLTTVKPCERNTWRSGVRSAVPVATLEGATDVDDALVLAYSYGLTDDTAAILFHLRGFGF